MGVLFGVIGGVIIGFILCALISGDKYGEYEYENMKLNERITYQNGIIDYYKNKYNDDYKTTIKKFMEDED